jgi:hypothetical protein
MVKRNEIMNLYRDLMEEVRIRLDVVIWAIDKSGLPPPITREFCSLQFRLICEDIALGCLIVHEDIAATKAPRFQKEWSAGAIMSMMAELHPHFYPQPVRQEVMTPGKFQLIGIDPATAFPRDELVDFYNGLNNPLHKGSLRNLLKPRMPIEKSYTDIRGTARKLGRLLSLHWISRLDGDSGFICMLHQAETGRVQVAFAEAAPLTSE